MLVKARTDDKAKVMVTTSSPSVKKVATKNRSASRTQAQSARRTTKI